MEGKGVLYAFKERSDDGPGAGACGLRLYLRRDGLDLHARADGTADAAIPAYAGQIERYGKKWIGKPCYDCAQLTRDVARRAGVSLPSGATSQWRAAGIWKEKDVIDTLPDEAGIFLFTMRDGRMTHTGVSIGHGEEVDARGHAYGVVRRPIRGTTFTHWARLAVDYDAQEDAEEDAGEETPLKPRRTLRMGSSGEDVRALQTTLQTLGFLNDAADGKFGAKTRGGRSEIPEKERPCGRWNCRRGDVGGPAGGTESRAPRRGFA